VLTLLISLPARQAANINLSRRLITLRSSLGTAAIGSYVIGTVGRPILITSLANSSSNLVLSTLSILFLTVLPWALKTAPNSSLISSIWLLSQALISLLSTACYIAAGATKTSRGCITTAAKLSCVYCVA